MLRISWIQSICNIMKSFIVLLYFFYIIDAMWIRYKALDTKRLSINGVEGRPLMYQRSKKHRFGCELCKSVGSQCGVVEI